MSAGFVSSWRLALIGLAVVAVFGISLNRLVHLHVVQGPTLAAKAQDTRDQLVIQQARRGSITDRRGHLLAGTNPLVEVGIDPQAYREEDLDKLPQLATLLGIPLQQVEAAVARRVDRPADGAMPQEVRAVRWVKLHDGIPDSLHQQVLALGIRGVYGNRRFERFYPGGSLAAHLLGFVNREGTAVVGLERTLDFYLRGQDGWIETERDGRRRELARFRQREIPAQPGLSVELTLDSVVQHLAEREVARLVGEYDPQGVSIIISEPATGAILALANHPTFDPNEFNRFPVETHRNRAVTDVFEPGSTFKIVPIAAALEERLVSPESVVDCGADTVTYRGRTIRMPGEAVRIFGRMTVVELTAKSSNRGAARLGMMLGDQRMHDYAQAFGFGRPTGWLAGAEVAGILHPVPRWDGLTISRLPMGHAVAATPLQVHLATSVIANNGVLMAPKVVRRVADHEGQTVVEFGPYARERVVSDRVARIVADMLMQAAAPGGTAHLAAIPAYEVAGKTGTTQKLVEGRYSRQHHVASFSGFFPASAPRVVITVIVDEPKIPGPAYGGRVSAPAFRNLGEQLIQYLALQPPRPADERGMLAQGNQGR